MVCFLVKIFIDAMQVHRAGAKNKIIEFGDLDVLFHNLSATKIASFTYNKIHHRTQYGGVFVKF